MFFVFQPHCICRVIHNVSRGSLSRPRPCAGDSRDIARGSLSLPRPCARDSRDVVRGSLSHPRRCARDSHDIVRGSLSHPRPFAHDSHEVVQKSRPIAPLDPLRLGPPPIFSQALSLSVACSTNSLGLAPTHPPVTIAAPKIQTYSRVHTRSRRT